MTKSRNPSAVPRKDTTTGTWWFIVDIGVGPDGNRRQAKRRGFSTKKAAQEELDKLRRAASTNSYVAPAKMTVSEYFDVWLNGLPAAGLRPSTVDGYRRCLLYVRPAIGGRRLDQLTPLDLDSIYTGLLA